MPRSNYVYVNAAMHSHPGVIRLRSRAVWAWVASICWASRHKEERFPKAILSDFNATPGVIRELTEEGFWVDSGDHYSLPRRPLGRGIEVWRPGPAETTRPYISAALRLSVFARDGFACVDCGATDRLSLDHIYPFSLGGPDTEDNLQTLCRTCNSRKGARV